ncbi:hypothetical protein [Streptosporangium canum]|uniref:hypothetical protein n=1 Tax=Streptosporangium canum TaxID=324952 RepID=UPI00379E6F2C
MTIAILVALFSSTSHRFHQPAHFIGILVGDDPGPYLIPGRLERDLGDLDTP